MSPYGIPRHNEFTFCYVCSSCRSKHVELVPYFTTRLVDDFASHIRLYRRALERVREHQKDGKNEGIVIEFYSSLQEIYFVQYGQSLVSNISLLTPVFPLFADTKPPADLESIFFDLETEMENNMCRDMICTNPESERRKSILGLC